MSRRCVSSASDFGSPSLAAKTCCADAKAYSQKAIAASRWTIPIFYASESGRSLGRHPPHTGRRARPQRRDSDRRPSPHAASHCTETTIDVRDRALLLLGFAGAFRRSEFVALDAGDVRFVVNGLEVTLTSLEDGSGRRRPIDRYSLRFESGDLSRRAMRAWLDRSGIARRATVSSVDRSGHVAPTRLTAAAVALIVKRHAKRIGLDPARFAGHSLRAGFATSAALAGVDALEISRQTGHKSLSMVQRYTRPATIWQMNAAQRVGL